MKKNRMMLYGLAGIGDNGSYSFVSSFLLFFLTSVQNIPASAAGFITFIGGAWNAIWGSVIGYISDHSHSKTGRRSPFIFAGGCILFGSTILLFLDIDGPEVVAIVYYALICLLFWVGFSTFFIPYAAMGAEITSDYHERTVIKSYTSFFNIVGGIVGMTLPTWLVSTFEERGATTENAWCITSIVVATIVSTSIFITWGVTKETNDSESSHNIFFKNAEDTSQGIFRMIKELRQIISLRPLQKLMISGTIFLIACTLVLSGRIYYLTCNLGLNGIVLSIIYFYFSLIGMMSLILVRSLSRTIGKKEAYLLCVIVATAISVFFGVHGINNIAEVLIFFFFIGIVNNAYWLLIPSMIYDVSEVDEYKYGMRREGLIVSAQSFCEALSAAFASLLLGFILQLAGYDGSEAVQSDTCLLWIRFSITIIPAVLYAISGAIMKSYPLSQSVFDELKVVLEKRKAGEEYSISENLKKALK